MFNRRATYFYAEMEMLLNINKAETFHPSDHRCLQYIEAYFCSEVSIKMNTVVNLDQTVLYIYLTVLVYLLDCFGIFT